MPNQYTKFQAAAAQDPTSRAFTWREWKDKKQHGRRMRQKTNLPTYHGPERRSSNSDESVTGLPVGNDVATISPPSSPSSLPSSSLLLYLPSGGFRIDPFRSYPVAPSHEEMAVLDHCMFFTCSHLVKSQLTLHRLVHTCPIG